MTSKTALRAEALARRNALSPDVRAAASAAIAASAAAILARLAPRRIAAYLPIGSEVDPTALVDAARAGGAEVGFPAVVDHATLAFRRHLPGEPLVPGPFRTRAPADDAPPLLPDLVVLPLVAFDRTGARLGYGRGFYDRAVAALTMAGRRPVLLGLAFAVQEVDKIPHEPHDRHLDFIVTERETLDFRKGPP